MSVKIEAYRFGEMVVSGQTHHSDLKIINGRIVPNWWRKEGHNFCLDDIRDILNSECEILVIGTGAYGVMKVPESVKKAIMEHGLAVEIYPTEKAASRFNELVAQGKKVAGAFHLTC